MSGETRARRRRGAGTPAHAAHRRRTPDGAALAWAMLAAAALGAIVHRGALASGFTTDDLILFERARGLVAWPWTPWRLVSGRLWWMLAFPAFGTRPLPWHAVNLLLHAVNAALVTLWGARSGLRVPAALLAGGLFAVAASAMTVMWAATSVGELLACTCALAGLLALGSPRPRAAWAFAAFAAGLLCKETLALVPLAAVAAAPAPERGARLRAALPALAAGALLWAWLLAARRSTGSLEGEAYAFGWGPHVFANLRDYAGWALDRAGLEAPTGLGASRVGVPGLAALAAFALLAVRGRTARAGLAVFALALVPVLPLAHHTYVHYLYLPLAGWCVALGAAAEWLAGAAGEGAPAWAGAAVLLLAAALASARVLAAAETTPLAELPVPADGFVRRVTVERNARETLARELPADATVLVILRPAESRRGVSVLGGTVTGPGGPRPAYDLMSATLDDGRGLRALYPALRAVRFEDVLSGADSNATLATAAMDGRIAVTGRGPAAVAPIADIWVRNRMRGSAADLVRSARALWPADSGLVWRARALAAGELPR